MPEFISIDLIHLARQGDPRAIQELVEKFRKPLFYYAYNHLGIESEAEDLTQEVLFKAIRALPGFKGDAAIGTWLFRIMVNTCIDFQRKQSGHRFFSLDKSFGEEDSVQLELKDNGPSPDEIMERLELRSAVLEALKQLSPGHRTIVILHDINSFKYHEIAGIMKISIGTVKSRLFYARRELRKMLAPLMEI